MAEGNECGSRYTDRDNSKTEATSGIHFPQARDKNDTNPGKAPKRKFYCRRLSVVGYDVECIYPEKSEETCVVKMLEN